MVVEFSVEVDWMEVIDVLFIMSDTVVFSVLVDVVLVVVEMVVFIVVMFIAWKDNPLCLLPMALCVKPEPVREICA